MTMDYLAMDLVHGFQTKGKNLHVGGLIGLHGQTHLVIIRLPHSWVLKLMARAVLLAFVVVSLPWIGSTIGGFTSNFQAGRSNYDANFAIDYPVTVELLPLVFRDLTNEGLLKLGDRALLVSDGGDDFAIYDNPQILHDNIEMDLISHLDSERQRLIPEETYDFVFVRGFHADVKFIDRTLKVGGVAVVQLSDNPKVSFQKPATNYKIVYLRQFDSGFHSTIMAMRKTSYVDYDNTNSVMPQRRLLCLESSEAKKAALKKLEDVLLEPPRAASGKSNRYLRKTRYLPDLMGDSLESYPRRVFIDVAGDVGWFAKNYPTRNKDFEIYKVETVVETTTTLGKEKEVAAQIEISDWLRKNVKEEEYVVMKAEAEVVEDMVKSKAIGLVDELFLECKHQGMKKGINGEKSRRPYWECLALYGMLRDEGVAVHQWWS